MTCSPCDCRAARAPPIYNILRDTRHCRICGENDDFPPGTLPTINITLKPSPEQMLLASVIAEWQMGTQYCYGLPYYARLPSCLA